MADAPDDRPPGTVPGDSTGPGDHARIDDRLRDLAHDTEPLVVLAGPAAARSRGERRRARRRAAAVGAAAALVLGVGGWQLLPRLDATGTRTAPPAASAAPDPAPSASALGERLLDGLLPPSSLPYPVKWQWSVAGDAEAKKITPECGVPAVAGATATASRTFRAAMVPATAYEKVFVLPDATAAADVADGLRKEMAPTCGMSFATTDAGAWGMQLAHRSMGVSDEHTGVVVWVQSQGRYVAVLVLDSPKSPVAVGLGDEPDGPRPAGCLADSLDRMALDHYPAALPTTASGGTGGSYGSRGGTGAGKGPAKGAGPAKTLTADDC
jgi:hypothetical protein